MWRAQQLPYLKTKTHMLLTESDLFLLQNLSVVHKSDKKPVTIPDPASIGYNLNAYFAAAGPVIVLPLEEDGNKERGVRRYLKVTDFENGRGSLGGTAVIRPMLQEVGSATGGAEFCQENLGVRRPTAKCRLCANNFG